MHLRVAHAATCALAATLSLAPPVLGQPFVRIADETTAISRFRGTGTRTAMRDGQVAFVGTDRALGVDGVYLAPASGLGPFVKIADTATAIPGSTTGETFDRFYGADLDEGQVLFAGARLVGSSFAFRGTYLGSGGPLTTLLQAPSGPGAPPGAIIASMSGLNIAYRGGGPWYEPWILNHGAAPQRVWLHGGPAPGGGTFARGDIGDNPVRAGNLVVHMADVSHATGTDGGLYTYDASSGLGTVIANWQTPMPGFTGSFDFFHACDSDVASIVFTGKSGIVGQGGNEGVYQVPAAGGPITRIVHVGDGVPGDGGTFTAFGVVAVESDLVVFHGFKGVPWSPSYAGIFYTRLSGGPVHKLISTADVLAGRDVVDVSFNLRGLDAGKLAFDVQVSDPAAPGGVGYGVYVATLASSCYADCNGDSALTIADFACFQSAFVAAAPDADCNQDGQLTIADFACFQGAFVAGCP